MSISAGLSKIIPTKYDDIVFRNVSSNYKALEDIGSVHSGGRWNRKNKYGALYTALNENTAKEELVRIAQRQGLTIFDLAPRDMVKLRIKLNKVLDLTDQDNLNELGIIQEDIMKDDCSKCLEIADAARDLGFEAILSHSATGFGMNLNIFLDKLKSSSSVDEIDRVNFLP